MITHSLARREFPGSLVAFGGAISVVARVVKPQQAGEKVRIVSAQIGEGIRIPNCGGDATLASDSLGILSGARPMGSLDVIPYAGFRAPGLL